MLVPMLGEGQVAPPFLEPGEGSRTWNALHENNSHGALSLDTADPGDIKLLWPELPARLLLFTYSEPAWEYNCMADSTI